MREKELCEKHMGKFPVISISLKNVDGLTFEAAKAVLQGTIGREVSRLQVLLESGQLTGMDKDLYRRLIRVGTDCRAVYDMMEAVLTESLRTFYDLLEKHYGQKNLMLIDEYDIPFNNALCSRILISFGIIF